MSSTDKYKGDMDRRRPGRYTSARKGAKTKTADPERMRPKVADKRTEYGKYQTAERKKPIFEREEEKHKEAMAKSKKGEETDPDKQAEKKKREASLRKKLKLEKEVIFLHKIIDPFTKKRLKVGLKLLRELYLLSDLLLITSYEEGFGIPLLEAGLLRRPIFTSDIAPLPEIGGKEVNYFNLKESPEKIALRIIRFFKNDKSSLLFKKVITQYSWERIFKERIEPLLYK